MNEETKFRTDRVQDVPQSQRAAPRGRRGEDPLAELARLIGQEDPFAEFEGGARPNRTTAGNGGDARTARREPERASSARQDQRTEARTRDYERREYRRDEYRRDEIPRTRSRAEYDQTHSQPARGNGRGAYAYGGRDPNELARERQQYQRPPARSAPARAEGAYAPTTRTQSAYARQAETDPRYARKIPRDIPVRGRDDEYARSRTTRYDSRTLQRDQYEEDYEDADLPEQEDEAYEEAPRRGGRRALVIAVIVLLLLVGGSAAAFFGYRAVFGDRSAAVPPTISPAPGPTKMIPPAAKSAAPGEPTGNKQIYDRIGATPLGGERMVPQEEKPIEFARPGAAPAPQPGPQAAVPIPTPAPANPLSTDPKRVRTLTVRSDGTVVNPAPGTPAAPRAGQPLPLNAYASQPEETDPTAVPRQARTGPAPIQTPGPGPRAAVGDVPAGSYIVQVSSQKSEAEAQANWQALQTRYPSLLGNRQATIKRVDLGDRGLFYRAVVGPFGNRSQADELCQSLKVAGGDCIVQRN
jgi:hypothetical protein